MMLANNFHALKTHMAHLARDCGRDPSSIQLLAVSKGQSVEAILNLMRLGQRDFGESYLQEAEIKRTLLPSSLNWHFIGPIQSNKTPAIAKHFSWVHSVDRFKIAERLNDARPSDLPPLNICIQVNIDQEDTKSGIAEDELLALAKDILILPRLKLRGLMCIPKARDELHAQRMPFRRLAQLQKDLKTQGFALDTLSMGMSHDLEAAILEGATWVRIGTKLFGSRENHA